MNIWPQHTRWKRTNGASQYSVPEEGLRHKDTMSTAAHKQLREGQKYVFYHLEEWGKTSVLNSSVSTQLLTALVLQGATVPQIWHPEHLWLWQVVCSQSLTFCESLSGVHKQVQRQPSLHASVQNVKIISDSLQHDDYSSICTWPGRSGKIIFLLLDALWEIYSSL